MNIACWIKEAHDVILQDFPQQISEQHLRHAVSNVDCERVPGKIYPSVEDYMKEQENQTVQKRNGDEYSFFNNIQFQKVAMRIYFL